MAETFTTQRLIIRPFSLEDLEDIHTNVYADPDVCRYYCRETKTKAETKEWLTFRVTEAKYSDFHAWAVERKEDGRVIGLVRLEAYANRWVRFANDPEPPFHNVEVELSFAFGQAYWRRGYAAEASRPVIEYAFITLKLPRLMGGAMAENLASARLHKKLGYTVSENLANDGYAAILKNDRLEEVSKST